MHGGVFPEWEELRQQLGVAAEGVGIGGVDAPVHGQEGVEALSGCPCGAAAVFGGEPWRCEEAAACHDAAQGRESGCHCGDIGGGGDVAVEYHRLRYAFEQSGKPVEVQFAFVLLPGYARMDCDVCKRHRVDDDYRSAPFVGVFQTETHFHRKTDAGHRGHAPGYGFENVGTAYHGRAPAFVALRRERAAQVEVDVPVAGLRESVGEEAEFVDVPEYYLWHGSVGACGEVAEVAGAHIAFFHSQERREVCVGAPVRPENFGVGSAPGAFGVAL